MVMIDLDGVVIDKNYQITGDISAAVERVQQQGIIIIPNSDTPVERLADFFIECLGVKAEMLIGEKGAVVWHQQNNEFEFPCYIDDIELYVQKICAQLQKLNVKIDFCDAPIIIRRDEYNEPKKQLILIDNSRRQSISMFFRKTDAVGKMYIDEFFCQKCLTIVEDVLRPQQLNPFDYNEKYGIAICSPVLANKTLGFISLKTKFPNASFYMIGDGDTDIIEDDDVGHLAVANASTTLKAKSLFVATAEYTKGLAECLQWIADQ
jgi:hydroxymethylpyrimidine pyrophosphatase-like HAD family hydrolase